jgi:RNA polymerase sigma factor (sigma-70 family)
MASKAQVVPEPSDEERVRFFQTTGEGRWFAELFEKYRKKVFFSCRAFFENSERAEDATQETFLKAFQNMDRFREGDFASWLMCICKNICIDEYRKRRPERAVTVAAELEIEAVRNIEPDTDLRMATERLRLEMGLLTAEQRQCLELKIAGYSYEEIAERAGLPLKAVKSHLQNARRMLWIKMGPMLTQLR